MLRDRLGEPERTVDLVDGATVADVLDWVRAWLDDERLARSLAVAVNREYARPERRLSEGDEVALLPPVSGGRT